MPTNPFQGQTGKNKEKEKEKNYKSSLDGVVCSNSGNSIAPVYKRVSVRDKNLVRKVDEYNLEEFIQASKDQTDLALLQKRYLELGEIPNVDGTLGSHDLTLFPSNIHEVYKMVNDVDGNFNKLPDAIKNIFGNSQAYLKALLDGSYNDVIIKGLTPKEEPKKQEEPKKLEGDK